MQHTRLLGFGRATCAFVLSGLLATTALWDGVMTLPLAHASEAVEAEAPEADGSTPSNEPAAPSDDGPDASGQLFQELPLDGEEGQGSEQGGASPDASQDADVPDSQAARTDASSQQSSTEPLVKNPNRINAKVQLSNSQNPAATAGAVVVDGIKYNVNADGGTASVAGKASEAELADEATIAEKVVSGSDEYTVTSIEAKAFENCADVKSIVLPDSLKEIGKDAFKGCTRLERFVAGERNEAFSTHDGMLFNKDRSILLRCPEGKGPIALIPDQTASLADGAFAQCTSLAALQVSEGNRAYASIDGVLYSGNLARLVYAPALTVAANVAFETKTISVGAFSDCDALSSIIATGFVEEIEDGAFSIESLASVVVALSAGNDYNARKAVWEQAGFATFSEPAVPGEIQQPASGTESGFAYQLLDDYTLAVSWVGESEPEADLVIPSSAKLGGVEYRVSAIAPKGFQGHLSLSSVQIRAPIQTIGDDAFAGCANLSSIELADGIASIGARAFSGTAVERLTIPASVASVGSEAFADSNLSRIIALSNSVDVADDALAGCSNVSVYVPYDEGGAYPWNVGVPASGNHLMPYGVSLPADPCLTFVGQEASLLESNPGEESPVTGYIEAPEGVEAVYTYAAGGVYVDPAKATVKGKAEGVSEVVVSLELDGVELARAVRTVEVMHSAAPLAGSTGDWAETFTTPSGHIVEGGTDNSFIQGIGQGTNTDNNLIIPGNQVVKLNHGGTKESPFWLFSIDSGYRAGEFVDKASLRSVTLEDGSIYEIGTSWYDNPVFDNCTSLQWLKFGNGLLYIEGGSFVGSDAISEIIVDCSLTTLGSTAFDKAVKDNTIVRIYDRDTSTYAGEATANPTAGPDSFSLRKKTWTDAGFANVVQIGTAGDTFWNADRTLKFKVLSVSGTTGTVSVAAGDTKPTGALTIPQTVTDTESGNIYTVTEVASGGFLGCSITSISADSALATVPTGSFDSSVLNSAKVTIPNGASFAGCKAAWTKGGFAAANVVASNLYTVTFETNGAEPIAQQSKVYGEKVVKPADPAREGYIFDGWRTSAGEPYDFAAPATGNITLHAAWIAGYVSGTCGWNIDADKLSIWPLDGKSGTLGEMGGDKGSDVPWDGKRDSIESVAFSPGVIGGASLAYMFANCKKLTSIDFSNFDTKNVQDMTYLFGGCSSLKTLDITGLDTSQVTSMASLFSFCSKLEQIDVSKLNTSKVENANNMFYSCSALTSLDVSGFDTRNFTNISGIFFDCSNLTELDVSNFSTSNVNEMSGPFSGCSGLTDLDISNFDMSSVTTIYHMFYGCTKLANLTLPDRFIGASMKYTRAPFAGCQSLTSIPSNLAFGSLAIPEGCFEVKGDTRLSTTYTGNDTALLEYNWEKDGRSLDFAVTFDPSNGSPSWTQTAEYGTLLQAPNEPVKDGYTFLGWFADPTDAAAYDFNTPINGSLTLHAKWSKKTYEVTFDLRFGNIDGNEDNIVQTVNEGDLVTPPTDPVKEGYTFIGWFEQSVYGRPDAEPWDFSTGAITKKTIFCAGWELDSDGTFYQYVDGQELRFKIIDGTNVRIIRNDHGDYTEISGDLVIPETIEYEGTTYTIIEIGNEKDTGTASVFQNCVGLTSVSIPATVKVLGGNAFCDCSGLKSVTFAEDSQLETISMGAIARTAITSVVVPDNVKYIGVSAFLGCSALSSVTLNVGLETIDRSAFNSTIIEAIEIPDSVTTIKGNAFINCLNLKSVSIPASVQTMGDNLFGNCLKLATIYAQNTIAEVDPTAFTYVKSRARVLLPAQSPDGKLTFDQLAAAWGKNGYGFENIVASSGALPTESNASNNNFDIAGWSLSADGVLEIHSTENVADFKWTWDGTPKDQKHWGPWRQYVKSIDTTKLTAAKNMDAWFVYMPNLTDISKVVLPSNAETMQNLFCFSGVKEIPSTFKIPAGAKDISSMFNQCSALKSIPEGFTIPDKVTSISYMFGYNPNLTDLPKSFTIPASVKEIRGFFRGWTSLTAVPESFVIPKPQEGGPVVNVDVQYLFADCSSLTDLRDFTLPSNVTNMPRMFAGCESLSSLPEGFSLPEKANCLELFDGCTSLAALPDNFTVPSTVTNAAAMFRNCISLTSLPDNFDMPGSAKTDASVFQVDGKTLPMYYGGSNPNVTGYCWADANRTFVTPESKPDGILQINLRVKNASDPSESEGEMWKTAYTDESGILATPGAPTRDGKVFTMWYADKACTELVDFTEPFVQDGTIYGVFADAPATGEIGGALPTVTGTGGAFWFIDGSDTLYIRGAGTVVDLGWSVGAAAPTEGYWSPYRTSIKKVVVDPSLSAQSTNSWFAGMSSLVDSSEANMPAGVVDVEGMFKDCALISKLPAGFSMPEGVTAVSHLFDGCASLSSLPEGFALPDSLRDTSYLLAGCSSLRSLPESFRIPESATSVRSMFDGCTALAALPEGFTIPSSVGNMMNVFNNCPSLTSLPESFDFPDLPAVKGDSPEIAQNAFSCYFENGGLVTTYYAGESDTVLGYDWAGQNRMLIADASDRGLFTVTFKTMGDDGAWKTRTTSVTDSAGIATNPGIPQHGDYAFTGWCEQEDCLQPFDFATPLSENKTLYGKWIVAGGKDADGGKLPTVAGSGEAWWRITNDGELDIVGDGKVSDLKMTWDDSTTSHLYWDDHRSAVKSVYLDERITIDDMAAWFCRMPNLVNVSGMRIPEGTSVVHDLFRSDGSLEYLPQGFSLPGSVVDASAMFQDCAKLKSLPASFQLPAVGKLQLVGNMFNGCTALKTLPKDFAIPGSVTSVPNMFAACANLTALPEEFSVPSSVTVMDGMFNGCSSLTYLPASFDFPLAVAQAAENPFKCETETETYFAGAESNPTSSVMSYNWSTQNRKLVTDAVPSTQVKVTLHVPNAKTNEYEEWMSFLAPTGTKITAPNPDVREGAAFAGWFNEKACTTPFDFTKEVTGNVELYAKYQGNSGKLPTTGTDNEFDASWELTADGTLKIHCAKGAVISDLGWTNDDWVSDRLGQDHWGPFRDEVICVQMDPAVDAVSMAYWFRDMDNLADVSGAFIPNHGNTVSIEAMLSKTGITSLPEGFTIPDSVVEASFAFYVNPGLTSLPETFRLSANVRNVNSMFQKTGLTKLPAGFVLPSAVESAHDMFHDSNIETLPDGFTIPDKVTNVQSMFINCYNLRSLPDSFRLGKSVSNIKNMFQSCVSLASLPSGFTIPKSVTLAESAFQDSGLNALPEKFAFEQGSLLTNANKMFAGCALLGSLPASLDLKGMTNLSDWKDMFLVLPPYSSSDPKLTYYSGDPARLLPAGVSSDATTYWRENFNRELITSTEGLSAHTVAFKTKVAGADAWNDVQTALTDDAGKVPDPGQPSKYGYSFDGWYTDEACKKKFDFSKSTASKDMSLYGVYRLRIDVDVPLRAKVAVDATGTVTPVMAQMKSYTPTAVQVTGITANLSGNATQVMDEASLEKARVTITSAGKTTELAWNAATPVGNPTLAAALDASSPSIWNYTIGLSVPKDVKYVFLGDGFTSDLARLTYTVAPVS